MKYMYIVAAVLAGAHAYMFGRWLKKNSNKVGAWVAYLLAVSCVAISVYRIVAAH